MRCCASAIATNWITREFWCIQRARQERQLHRSGWDYLILAGALGVFVALGVQARRPQLAMDLTWTAILSVLMVVSAAVCAWKLWKVTRFA